ncbi:hypothetical protein ABID22_002158 [Pontibacter aydingkolensis]
MKKNNVTSSDYQDYLSELLGRVPNPLELLVFERNQDLLRITKRKIQNDAYHITFTNCTEIEMV